MTLNQLRYFSTVCARGSVTKAAEALNITQPSISNAIRELEKEFDVVLFLRQNKRLVLTKEGAAFLEIANDLLKDTDRAEYYMRTLSKNKVMRIGVPPMLSSLITPALHSSFLKHDPGFKISIVEGQGRGEISKKLENNEIDVAILPHLDAFEMQYCYESLGRIQNVCCVSTEHTFAGKSSISISDLANEPLILFQNSFFQTDRILERFAQEDIAPNILLSTIQLSTLQNMVANNLGIGFVYEFVLGFSQNIVGIPLDPPMFTNISLVWKNQAHTARNINKLLRFLRAFYEAPGQPDM